MLDKLKQTLSNVRVLFWSLIVRVFIFFGLPNWKKLIVFGGVASVITYFVAAAVISAANPAGVKVILLLINCLAWVVATRASWKW